MGACNFNLILLKHWLLFLPTFCCIQCFRCCILLLSCNWYFCWTLWYDDAWTWHTDYFCAVYA